MFSPILKSSNLQGQKGTWTEMFNSTHHCYQKAHSPWRSFKINLKKSIWKCSEPTEASRSVVKKDKVQNLNHGFVKIHHGNPKTSRYQAQLVPNIYNKHEIQLQPIAANQYETNDYKNNVTDFLAFDKFNFVIWVLG